MSAGVVLQQTYVRRLRPPHSTKTALERATTTPLISRCTEHDANLYRCPKRGCNLAIGKEQPRRQYKRRNSAVRLACMFLLPKPSTSVPMEFISQFSP
jgi:hypothetical protein